ncbi:FimV/HubP family polar landmark protein, partial [Acinetobacter baumannii]
SYGRYGPVLPSETLWSIATKLRPSPAITMDQVLLAIYRGNPQAFEGGINGLLKGATLSVPSAEDMSRVDAVGAHAEVSA